MDIVERLRKDDPVSGVRPSLAMEAADEIERLQKELELTPAQYWEAQASMWHENYKEAMAHEEEARRYKVALERIRDSGYGTKERIRLIIAKALGGG